MPSILSFNSLNIMTKEMNCDDPTPSSLAKGYDSGPPSLHPWRI